MEIQKEKNRRNYIDIILGVFFAILIIQVLILLNRLITISVLGFTSNNIVLAISKGVIYFILLIIFLFWTKGVYTRFSKGEQIIIKYSTIRNIIILTPITYVINIILIKIYSSQTENINDFKDFYIVNKIADISLYYVVLGIMFIFSLMMLFKASKKEDR